MKTSPLPLSLRFALGAERWTSGFYILVACIAVGVGAIAGINSVSQALTQGIAAEGRVILGGDLAFSLVHRQATPDEMAFFAQNGEVGAVATMRAMVRRADETNQALVELKAVDAHLPAWRSVGSAGRRRSWAAAPRRTRRSIRRTRSARGP
jgi:putative ABC transport system permease protein